MKQKAVFKLNNANLALLCSECRKIIKVGSEFTEEEMNACIGKSGFHIPPQYCDKCKVKKKRKAQNKSHN